MAISLRQGWDRAVSLALPPRCPSCSTVVEGDHRFCSACWTGLRFLTDPSCAACGLPFEYGRGAQALCVPCAVERPAYDAARAAVAYDAHSRALVLKFKYGRRIGLARTIARLMVRNFPNSADLIVPVPLHRRRIWSRGFNQSALIGQEVSRLTGVAQSARLLLRVRPTPVMRGLNPRQRKQAVAHAFEVGGSFSLSGQHIVLIDDVHTSGATAAACARALKSAGAGRVTLLCWARVLKDDKGA